VVTDGCTYVVVEKLLILISQRERERERTGETLL